jgi:hypothetical protein
MSARPRGNPRVEPKEPRRELWDPNKSDRYQGGVARHVHYYFDRIKPYVMKRSVEIDESLFGRRVKNNRGNPHGHRVWIFGLVESETNYLKQLPVDRRGACTLTAIIKENVAPGTTIRSDA